MKKLLKILFMSTMAVIPLSSSVVLAACNFSMENTEVTISGINNNAIYIDALKDPNKEGETNSPRNNNKIVDIKIKSPLKGYKIIWKFSGNTVRIQNGSTEMIAQLITVEEIKNEPGTSNVSLRVKSNTYITSDIENATLEFLYFNPNTNTTIIPDIKNRSINVQVHRIEVTGVANPIDISNLSIPTNNIYNFDPLKAAVTRETFLKNYILEIIDRKINNENKYDFLLNKNYDIFLNNKKIEEDQSGANSIIDSFYEFDKLTEISVDIKSTNEATPNNYTVTGEFSYVIKHDPDAALAPVEPGADSPEDPGKEYDISKINFTSYEYNFKDMDDEFKESFPENYVKNYVEGIIDEKTGKGINSKDNYIVTLKSDKNFDKNFWEDKEQQAEISYFFKRPPEPETRDDSISWEPINETITFEIKSRLTQNSNNQSIGNNSFTYINNESRISAPKIPGQEEAAGWINIAFNAMFNGAPIDLSGMGGKNTQTTLFKEGLGGLILQDPIILSSNADIKSAVTKGFNVFHDQITKETTIQNFVREKPTGNKYFDENDDKKEDFIKIIKDKTNWTINWWKHTGLAGQGKQGASVPDAYKNNLMSTISYALTVSARKKLEDIFILPRTDSFQFPMYVQATPAKNKDWDMLFGHKEFIDHYQNNKMGLVIGNTTDFVSGKSDKVLTDDEVFEKNTYENILTQQALGTFKEGGIPNHDQTQYLTSGADFFAGAHNANKYYDITAQDSDNFKDGTKGKVINNIRAIYGNDILEQLTKDWARMKFGGSGNTSEIEAKFQQKKLKVKYRNQDGLPVPDSSTTPLEIGDELTLSKDKNNKDGFIETIDNAYFLDLTDEKGYSTSGGNTDIAFFDQAQAASFYRVMMNGEQIPSTIEGWDFLDDDEKNKTLVGVTPKKELNWLKYNIYNLTSQTRPGAQVSDIREFGAAEVPDLIDKNSVANPNDVVYLYINTYVKVGAGSEMTDKTIRHVVIKVNKK